MNELILRSEAAAIVGVAPSTFSAYVSRGQAPRPVDHVGSTPRWDAEEVREWARTRPGRVGRPRGSTTKGDA